MNQALSEILIDFSKIFPVYELDIKDRGKFNFGEDCILNKNAVQLVTFDAPSQQDKPKNNPTNIYNNKPIDNSNVNPSTFYNNNSVIPSTNITKFTDDQIKKIYIN